MSNGQPPVRSRSREGRLSGRAIKILSKKRGTRAGERAGGRANECASERCHGEKKGTEWTKRNLKGHPSDTPLYAAVADTPAFCTPRSTAVRLSFPPFPSMNPLGNREFLIFLVFAFHQNIFQPTSVENC